MLKEYISTLLPKYEFKRPVSQKKLREVEKGLGINFPEDLKRLLCETDGVKEEYGIDFLWSIKRIHDENLNFRTCKVYKEIYMPFDSLLFFADASNGDQFAFPVVNGSNCRDDVFTWNHEDDSRTWVAPSLKQFIKWWANGTIKI